MSPGNYDGVVCFGGVDWWYHNRGHYDLQMMREFSARMPVLYINSIGMRVPRVGEGAMFVKRVTRKLKSLSRGLVRVRKNFGVFSPVFGPGRLGEIVAPFVPGQIRRAARRMGIRNPLVWVACPPGVRFLDALDPAALVYQRTDRFEAFAGVDPEFISACNERLLRDADLTLYCSSLLLDEEREKTPHPAFVDHGVDFDTFERAGLEARDPADVASIPRPRAGFVGGIDAHTFDPELFLELARRMDDVQFVLVGGCSLPEDWCTLPNVHLLGRKPYDEVARYMAASDVLLMPWNKSDWVRACNPVKLKEYLAVGRPIVSTDFHELASYAELVRTASDAEGFEREIRAALAKPFDPAPGRERVRSATWTAHAERVLELLAKSGVHSLSSPTTNR
ncbi:MAG TPA: glycosyltransferase [Planctomycetes bacterium]|nr:glycosyltransferase [Planctomycetota bacterium]